ncbi:hypothetical protein [Flammeovirga aprica]|uniref:Uncharacterized protein n=1 Tax=Flammeovirga aprica JL-4 TaxID=694437 RepID=A0A7X9RSY1_9BACT|nr:hypothetical protein [Flammeovirga aprica]NME67785.1 hypothetical protein [Flammeovirga aprica JL-4]
MRDLFKFLFLVFILNSCTKSSPKNDLVLERDDNGLTLLYAFKKDGYLDSIYLHFYEEYYIRDNEGHIVGHPFKTFKYFSKREEILTVSYDSTDLISTYKGTPFLDFSVIKEKNGFKLYSKLVNIPRTRVSRVSYYINNETDISLLSAGTIDSLHGENNFYVIDKEFKFSDFDCDMEYLFNVNVTYYDIGIDGKENIFFSKHKDL